MESDSNFSLSNSLSSIAAPPLSEGRKEGMLLPESEIQLQPPGVFNKTSVTLGSTIPKTLQEAYNNSFVALTKPEILTQTSQGQLLQNAEMVKNVAQQMIGDTEEASQVTAASNMLATTEAFLQAAQRQYQLYFAPGAIHEEQTHQNVPTIATQLEEKDFDQEGLQNTLTTVKNVAMKALILT